MGKQQSDTRAGGPLLNCPAAAGDTRTPIAFFEALNGYQRSAVMKGALELDLFSAISALVAVGTRRDAAAIASRCKASERGIRILCDTLTVQGFLIKEGDEYRLTPDSALFLNRASPAYIGAAADFLLSPRLREAFADVAGAVRKGGTVLPGEGTMSHEDPVWDSFASGMAAVMRMPAEMLADTVLARFPEPKAVLDVSASHGEFGFAFARRIPDLELHVLDWESVLRITMRRAAEHALSSRVHPVPGDLFSVSYPTALDLVLLPNILHHFDRATCITLLMRARAALKPGGAVAVLEFIPNDDRVSPVGSALFAIIMLCSTPRGDAYTFAEYEEMLNEAGFTGCELHELAPGMQRAITARTE